MKVHRDANHAEIVQDLETCGFTVADMAAVGDGFPDIAIGAFGFTFLAEIKRDAKAVRRKSKTRARQVEFAESWKGAPIIVAISSEEIIRAIAAYVRRRHQLEQHPGRDLVPQF